MKKSIVMALATMIFGFSTLANANNLNALITKEVKKSTSFLNKSEAKTTGYQYTLANKNITYTDINNDGKKDAVVALHYCEKISCHMTTRLFDIAVFLNTGKGKYQYGDAYTVGLTGDFSVKNGIIYANSLLYNEHEDPDCCPSHKEMVKLRFTNGKLAKVK